MLRNGLNNVALVITHKPMRKRVYICASLAILLAIGCNKIKSLTNISVDVPFNESLTLSALPDTNITIPSHGYPLSLPKISVTTNSQQYISQNNTSSDKVNSVTLKSITMQVTNPTNGNFNFLDTIKIFISADSLPEQLLAYDYNVTRNQNQIKLTSANLDIKTYFLKPTMSLRVYTNLDSVLKKSEQVNINTDFTLAANPLN